MTDTERAVSQMIQSKHETVGDDVDGNCERLRENAGSLGPV